MTLLLTVIGLLLIAITVFDIFETLFDPEDQGRLTWAVCWVVWTALKPLGKPLLGYAGPIAYATVLGLWAIFLLSGWAFVYWPQLPDSFEFHGDLDPDRQTGFITAFYVSLTTSSTLGYGDITPVPDWLRVFGPAQSLLGFLLLSAAITWILAIYQDIETRRSLAHETTLLQEALESSGISMRDLEAQSIERLIDEVTSRIVRVTGSLNQFPITYFFRISDDRQSLAVMSLFLLQISEELSNEHLPAEVRLRARMLSGALDHLAETLKGHFIDVDADASTRDVLNAYAKDHRRDAAVVTAER